MVVQRIPSSSPTLAYARLSDSQEPMYPLVTRDTLSVSTRVVPCYLLGVTLAMFMAMGLPQTWEMLYPVPHEVLRHRQFHGERITRRLLVGEPLNPSVSFPVFPSRNDSQPLPAIPTPPESEATPCQLELVKRLT